MGFAAEIERGHALGVLLLCELFIEEAVTFLVQPRAPKAVRAPKAIFAVPAPIAVLAVLTRIALVAIRTIRAVHAPLAVKAKREVAAAGTFARVARVIHVFAGEDRKAVVAILGAYRHIRVVAVLRPHVLEVVAGLGTEQPTEVFEEGQRDPSCPRNPVAARQDAGLQYGHAAFLRPVSNGLRDYG